ncbi:MAG: dCTP deaminase [Patescibacteria group bacterium]
MVLGVDELLKLVKSKKLVEGLCDRELTNPEGSGFDLRLGKVHKISGKGFLGIDERNSADSKLVAEYNPKKKKSIIIKPAESYLVTTLERVNLPQNLTAKTWMRSTLYRSGIIMSAGNVPPGYQGELTFLFYNAGKAKMEIELGARIVHILFWEVKGKTNAYRGQWQGGRVTTKKREKQI